MTRIASSVLKLAADGATLVRAGVIERKAYSGLFNLQYYNGFYNELDELDNVHFLPQTLAHRVITADWIASVDEVDRPFLAVHPIPDHSAACAGSRLPACRARTSRRSWPSSIKRQAICARSQGLSAARRFMKNETGTVSIKQ